MRRWRSPGTTSIKQLRRHLGQKRGASCCLRPRLQSDIHCHATSRARSLWKMDRGVRRSAPICDYRGVQLCHQAPQDGAKQHQSYNHSGMASRVRLSGASDTDLSRFWKVCHTHNLITANSPHPELSVQLVVDNMARTSTYCASLRQRDFDPINDWSFKISDMIMTAITILQSRQPWAGGEATRVQLLPLIHRFIGLLTSVSLVAFTWLTASATVWSSSPNWSRQSPSFNRHAKQTPTDSRTFRAEPKTSSYTTRGGAADGRWRGTVLGSAGNLGSPKRR